MSLSDKQNEAIDLLILGTVSKLDIAKRINVAEKTIYNWLNKEEFKAELQKRTDNFNNIRNDEAKNKLSSMLDMALNNIAEIAQDRSHPKCFESNKYIIDRNLGNTTTKIEQSNSDDNNNKDIKDIDSMLKEIDNKENNVIDLPKKVGK